jgi:hypothetical protein
MSIKKTWIVEQLRSYPTQNNKVDVVFSVAWRLNGTDGTYSATIYGDVSIPHEVDNNFTPYANLTSQMAVTWVRAALGIDTVLAYESSIDDQIANLINPPVVTLPIPWKQ